MTPDYAGLLHALLPEASLVLGALLVIGFDVAVARRSTAAARLNAAVCLGLLALAAALLTVAAAPAFAQGGSPYNRSGSQAGGPLGGIEPESVLQVFAVPRLVLSHTQPNKKC